MSSNIFYVCLFFKEIGFMTKNYIKKGKAKRDKLYYQNPYCPRCGVEMILPKDIPKNKKGYLKYEPDNLCTLEHKYTRFEEKRGSKKNSNGILCKKCNREVAAEKEINMLSIEERRRRSGRHRKDFNQKIHGGIK